MQIKKHNIKMSKIVYEGEIKSSAEGSIIVPDVNPDIIKVLQADAEAFLCEKTVEDGKITLKGKVNVNVLYVPEDGNSCICSLKNSFEFCETLKRTEFEDNMRIATWCNTEKVTYKLINSRKISIAAHLEIGVLVTGEANCGCVCDIEASGAQMKKDAVSVFGENCDEFDFTLEDTFELPAAVSEILKVNTSIFDRECKTLVGKAVAKGKMCVNILCIDESNRCVHYDFEFPFTEVFDVESAFEGAKCDITYETGEIEAVLERDDNGNLKRIAFTADITVSVRTEYSEEATVLTDCFFTDCECEQMFGDMEFEEILDRPVCSATLREVLPKTQGAPDIGSVYATSLKPRITATQLRNGRLAVSGSVAVCVLYTADTAGAAVGSIKEEIPFNCTVDCGNSDNAAQAVLSAECDRADCTVLSPSSAELCCTIKVSGKIVRKKAVNVITDITTHESAETERGIVVYFSDKEDSLWGVAKRYRVSEAEIAACNELNDMRVGKGDKLIIAARC